MATSTLDLPQKQTVTLFEKKVSLSPQSTAELARRLILYAQLAHESLMPLLDIYLHRSTTTSTLTLVQPALEGKEFSSVVGDLEAPQLQRLLREALITIHSLHQIGLTHQ